MPEPVLTGGCLCGGVRFELSEPPVGASYCHCTRCQRRTGTAAAASARIAPGSLRITAGEELIRSYEPPAGGFAKDTMRNFEAGPEGAEILAMGGGESGVGDAEMTQDWWSD